MSRPVTSAECIWYVSKYLALPSDGSPGSRGYLLAQEMAAGGRCVVLLTSISHDQDAAKTLAQYGSSGRLKVLKLRVRRHRSTRSLTRILGWLEFEWRLLLLPLGRLPSPDVVIVSSLSLLTVFNGLRLRRHFGCPLVFEVRDIWPLTLVEEGGFSSNHPGVRFLAWVERLGYRQADVIVGTMPNLVEHVEQVLGQRRLVHCIPMGSPAIREERQSQGVVDEVFREVPLGSFIVGYAGSIGVTNALDTLFGCAELMEKDPSVHFLVIGDGDLSRNYAERFGHLRNVTRVRKIPRDGLHEVLKYCDLLHFGTLRSEVWRYGQSLNKLADYMLAGRPIVGSYSGFPSMVSEANSGSFVPAEDPHSLMAEILRWRDMDEQVRNEIGARGRAWIESHRSYPALAAEYVAILDDSIKHSRAGRRRKKSLRFPRSVRLSRRMLG